MVKADHEALKERVRAVLERITVEERQLLNAVMRVEAEHLHKANPQVKGELIAEIERFIK